MGCAVSDDAPLATTADTATWTGCGPEAPEMVDASAWWGPADDGEALFVSTLVTDADRALHTIHFDLWVDDEADGDVAIGVTPTWSGSLDLLASDTVDAEVCDTPGGFPILLKLTADELPTRGQVQEIALRAADADGHRTGIVVTEVCEAMSDDCF